MPSAFESLGAIEHLLYEALETERGGVEVYTVAISCAKNEALKKEWTEYKTQTEQHVKIVGDLFETLGLDPEKVTPMRLVVRDKVRALLSVMRNVQTHAPEYAELVAAECIVDAETKDHKNWELLGEVWKALKEGPAKKALARAVKKIEDEEDEHLYHTVGWARELSLQALGLPAVLPPPEEVKEVKTAIAAARAKASRKAVKKRQAARPAARPRSRRYLWLRRQLVQLNRLREPFELHRLQRNEPARLADGELLDRVGYEDLPALGHRARARGEVDGGAVQVVALSDGLARAQADPDAEANSARCDRLLDLQRALDGAVHRHERREDAVAGVLHLAAAAARQGRAHDAVVLAQDLHDACVALARADVRRALDVGEHDGADAGVRRGSVERGAVRHGPFPVADERPEGRRRDLDQLVGHQAVGLLVARHRRVAVRRFDETERMSRGIVEPIREEPDAVLVLHGEVALVRGVEIFGRDLAEAAMDVHVQLHRLVQGRSIETQASSIRMP